MIYLIGGPPRTGKSILADIGLKKKQIPYCATDTLVQMLKEACPESGISDNILLPERAEKFFPYLDNFIKYASFGSNDYLLEGDVIWPRGVGQLTEKHNIKAVFLINTTPDLKAIIDNTGNNNWLLDYPKEEQEGIIQSFKKYSETIKQQCEELNLKCFDVGEDFGKKIKEAEEYLFG